MTIVFRNVLAEAATASAVPLTDRMLDACTVHFALLLKWNKTHNLTRIVDPGEAARKHYLDCLAPLLALRAGGLTPTSFVDVGSGAGFPGLLAALVWPQARATLVEPALKRLSFLTLAAGAMGLPVRAIAPTETRAPDAPAGPLPTPSADAGELVLSRATFSEGKRGELLRHALGTVVVWGHPADGATWAAEVATWPGWAGRTLEYAVEGLERRALLWATRGSST